MRRVWLSLLGAVVIVSAAACVGPEDTPSNVWDLRVLGIQTDPPDLMAPACVFSADDLSNPAVAQGIAKYQSPITFTALIEDPAGAGREISYELWACGKVGDRTCADDGTPKYLVASGKTSPGELRIEGLTPGLEGFKKTGNYEDALLFQVLQNDQYHGLGGIRVPLVLHLEAGSEEIYAQKLMLYSCNFFPQAPGSEAPTMKQNEQPELPGVKFEGEVWPEDEVRQVQGPGEFKIEGVDFTDREEHFVVPSFELKPIELDESWRISWFTDLGHFSPNSSGGSNVDGEEAKPFATWTPGSKATEQDVIFWFVVRDGRGGESWITRKAHYKP